MIYSYLFTRNYISAKWYGFSDSQSGLESFSWRAGTKPGYDDVIKTVHLPVTNILVEPNLQQNTLPLGERIYITITAHNKAGKCDKIIRWFYHVWLVILNGTIIYVALYLFDDSNNEINNNNNVVIVYITVTLNCHMFYFVRNKCITITFIIHSTCDNPLFSGILVVSLKLWCLECWLWFFIWIFPWLSLVSWLLSLVTFIILFYQIKNIKWFDTFQV